MSPNRNFGLYQESSFCTKMNKKSMKTDCYDVYLKKKNVKEIAESVEELSNEIAKGFEIVGYLRVKINDAKKAKIDS